MAVPAPKMTPSATTPISENKPSFFGNMLGNFGNMFGNFFGGLSSLFGFDSKEGSNKLTQGIFDFVKDLATGNSKSEPLDIWKALEDLLQALFNVLFETMKPAAQSMGLKGSEEKDKVKPKSTVKPTHDKGDAKRDHEADTLAADASFDASSKSTPLCFSPLAKGLGTRPRVTLPAGKSSVPAPTPEHSRTSPAPRP